MLEILYYPHEDHGPVSEDMTQLAQARPKAFARLKLDLQILGAEGLRSPRVTIRALGNKLWELKRLHEGVQYRIFFCVGKGAIWLLHSIEKKSARTPEDDLQLARKRLKEVMG